MQMRHMRQMRHAAGTGGTPTPGAFDGMGGNRTHSLLAIGLSGVRECSIHKFSLHRSAVDRNVMPLAVHFIVLPLTNVRTNIFPSSHAVTFFEAFTKRSVKVKLSFVNFLPFPVNLAVMELIPLRVFSHPSHRRNAHSLPSSH